MLFPVIQRGKGVTQLGFCLRVIVNEQPLNLKKTTSSVLSVLLLIYEFQVNLSIKECNLNLKTEIQDFKNYSKNKLVESAYFQFKMSIMIL